MKKANCLLVFLCIAFVMTETDLWAQSPQSSSYTLPAWGWNQGGCGGGTAARSSSSYRLIDSVAPPIISMGASDLPYLSGTNVFCYLDVLFAALLRTPNYVELHVRTDSSGGYDFNPGDTVVLEWATYENVYGFANVPCVIYLGAAMNPPSENTAVTVSGIASSGALFLFDAGRSPSRYVPGNAQPMYQNVRFPTAKFGSSGTLNFTVPSGAAGRWTFAAAFIQMSDGQFPSNPPVEVSNGFTLY